MHDEGDVIDVDAARSDISRDKRARGSIGERGEVSLASVLRQVSVHVDGTDSGSLELLRKLLRAVLRTREDDDTP